MGIGGDLLDLEAVELLPQVRDLYNRNLVNEGIVGTLADVEKRMIASAKPHWQPELKPLAEQYAYLYDPDTYLTEHPRPKSEEHDKALEAQMKAAELASKEWNFLYEADEEEDDEYEPQQPRRVAPTRPERVRYCKVKQA